MFVWRLGVNKNELQFKRWLFDNNVQILNIAGPRASNAPDIYGETLELLEGLLKDFIRESDRNNH